MISTIKKLSDVELIPEHQRKFYYIDESVTGRMPIVDCGEELVDIEHIVHNAGVEVMLNPVAPAPYDKPMYLRIGVANKLVAAARSLQNRESTYRLYITDTFRPLELQRKYFNEIRDDIVKKEGLTGDALWNRVTQFIADPDLCPPHSTGGAVDLTIFDTHANQLLDMGTKLDAIDDKSNTWTDTITDVQKQNRTLLYDVMIEQGFVNLATEWWHYSYGDGYWAAYLHKASALYGSIDALPIK